MNRIVKPFVVVLAAIYFLADAIFAAIAHPLARWIGEHWVLTRLRIVDPLVAALSRAGAVCGSSHHP